MTSIPRLSPMDLRTAFSRLRLPGAIRNLLGVLVCAMVVMPPASAQAAYEEVRYYHTDALGSVVAITDEQGTVVERFEYAPHGQLRSQAPRNGPGFAGHVGDATTGLVNMQQRYYSPLEGRFLSVDQVTPLGGDRLHFNRYAYAYNSPYRFIDGDGRSGLDWSSRYRGGLDLAGGDMEIANAGMADGLTMGLGVAGGAAVAAPLAYELGWLAFANPVTANNIAVAGAEAAAGTSIAVGGGWQVFRNLAPLDDIAPAMRFSVARIQKVRYSGRLNYVVTASGQLILGRTGHTSLSSGAGVLAAGEARFVNGGLKSMNNASGHYQPRGDSAKQAAEAAFHGAGFESSGKYFEKRF